MFNQLSNIFSSVFDYESNTWSIFFPVTTIYARVNIIIPLDDFSLHSECGWKNFINIFSKTLSNTQPNIKRGFLWDFFLILWRFNRNVWNITHVNRSPYNTTLMYLLLWTWQPIDRAIIYSLTIRLQIYRETTRIKHLLLYCIK